MSNGKSLALVAKGFTIIELLVVVSIIAILTGIVLVNVTQYLSKSRDSAAQGKLSSMLTNSAVFYDTTGNASYTAFINVAGSTATIGAGTACVGNTGYTGPCNAITATASTGYGFTYACADSTGAALNCNAAGVQRWAGMITLKNGGNTFCVDSTGAKVNKAGGTVTTASPSYALCL